MANKISPKTLKKSFWNWFFFNGCSQQAESMLGMAFGQAMAPIIDEVYETKEEKAAALKRNITLFNTESQVGSICNGVVCGLEETNAEVGDMEEVISSVKVALIGPTSAIGDSLWVATIIPLLLTICMTIGQTIPTMTWIAPLLYMLVYPTLTCFISWNLFKLGYKSGVEGVHSFMLSGKLDKLTAAMGILGLLIVGALTASYVGMSIPIQISQVIDGSSVVIFSADSMLNNIFPSIMPLCLTLLIYVLYSKKKWSPLALMGLILALAIILTGIGYVFGVYA